MVERNSIMTHLNEINQKQVFTPLSALAHVGSYVAEKPYVIHGAVFPFPERLNRKIARIYELMEYSQLNKEERKELKLLLSEDRVLAFHVSQSLLNAQNWGALSSKPGMKVLLKKSPVQSLTNLISTLEIALLMDAPPQGTFEMAARLSDLNILSDATLMYVVGHPQLPQHLQGKFQILFENYASELIV